MTEERLSWPNHETKNGSAINTPTPRRTRPDKATRVSYLDAGGNKDEDLRVEVVLDERVEDAQLVRERGNEVKCGKVLRRDISRVGVHVNEPGTTGIRERLDLGQAKGECGCVRCGVYGAQVGERPAICHPHTQSAS